MAMPVVCVAADKSWTVRTPDRRLNSAISIVGRVQVVDRDKFAIGSLHSARVAHIATGDIVSQDERITPTLTGILTEFRIHSKRWFAITIGDAQSTVSHSDQ